MMDDLTIIDFGMGNLGSIANMLKKIGSTCKITSDLKEIERAKKLILPGVGSYSQAMKNLNEMNVIPLLKLKAAQNIPILGICLGMQLLASNSEEGHVSGLNLIPGNVVKFVLPNTLKVPHMGWNTLKYKEDCKLFQGFDNLEEVRYYFVHSYHFQPELSEYQIASANYGMEFTCAVQKGNIYGVQFHPEKSHSFGMKLLQNFSQL
jgi:glutamine amidotransferase